MDGGAFGERTFKDFEATQPTVVKEEAPTAPAENVPQA